MTKAQIMKRAHEIARTLEGDYRAKMSIALCQAWTEAKITTKTTFNGFAKMVQPSREHYEDDCKYLFFKLWEKKGYRRVYINDYKRRTLGYIENGAFNLSSKQGLDIADINACVDTFLAQYEI